MERTNIEIHGYDKQPVYDLHTHLIYPSPIEQSVSVFKNIMRHFNYGKIHIASVAMHDVTENVKALYCKANTENIYCSGSINHYFDERDTADYFLSEIKKYHAMGCDGIKMLEGKGNWHAKLYTKNLADKVYEKFFEYAEQNEIPVLMHLGDPLEMWDLSKMSDYAIERGWYCGGEGMPSREDLRFEVEQILKKFPRLRLILAHFYFMADDLDRAAKLFDTYPNLCFDLTTGDPHFVTLTETYDRSREFFIKYNDRLLYGTDTYHFSLGDMNEEQRYGTRINQIRSYIETDDQRVLNEKPIKCLNLPTESKNKIYRDNFVRYYGENPKKIDAEMLLHECALIEKERTLDEQMRSNLKTIKEYFEKM